MLLGVLGLRFPSTQKTLPFLSIFAPNIRQALTVARASAQVEGSLIVERPSEREAAITALCVRAFEGGAFTVPCSLPVFSTMISTSFSPQGVSLPPVDIGLNNCAIIPAPSSHDLFYVL